jgi:hypothetical protein
VSTGLRRHFRRQPGISLCGVLNKSLQKRLPRKSRLTRGRSLDHKPPQRDEILLPRGGAPKGETDCPARLGRSKTQQFDPFIPHFGIGRNLWQERDAIAVGDHLHDGRQTDGTEAQRHVELHG